MSTPPPPAGSTKSEERSGLLRTVKQVTRPSTARNPLALLSPRKIAIRRRIAVPKRLADMLADSRMGDWAGRGFARLTVLPVICIVAWLVPGLPLLIAGDFTPVPVLLIAAPLAAALVMNLRVPASWPVELPGQARDRGWAPLFAIVATVAVAVGFMAWQLALKSPSVIPTRTPGAYFQTGYWIAQHGSLPIPGSLAAFGGAHAGLGLSSIGFFQYGHSVVPGVMAGWPMLLTAGFWTSGIGGGAVIGPVLGGLAVLSFGGLVGRLAGQRWAPAGAVALALTLPELYTSRDAFSEVGVQILIFGGMSLVVDALTVAGVGTKSVGTESTAESPGSTSVSAETTADVQAGHTRPLPAFGSPAESVRTDPAGTSEIASMGPSGSTGSTSTEPMAPIGLLGYADQWSRQAQGWLELRGRNAAERSGTRTWGAVPAAAAARLARLAARMAKSIWRGAASGAATPELVLAGLGGLSLGLTSLLSLGSLVYVIPAIVVAGVLIAARRAAGIAFAIMLCVGAGYGILAGYVVARPLADSQAGILEVIGRDASEAVVLTVIVALLVSGPRLRRVVGRLLGRRPLRWLPDLGGFLVIAVLAGLALRPYVQTVHGALGRAETDFVRTLQHLAGLRVDPTRLYSEDTLYWVIWYAGIATVLLGGFGAAVVLRRCLRSLLAWPGGAGSGADGSRPPGVALNWALPIAVILGGSLAILWQPFTVPDQPWASRRLVPVVLPGLILCAIWAAAWLTRRARNRGAGVITGAVVSTFCVAAMLLPALGTSFGFGLTHSGVGGGLRPVAGGLAQHRIRTGESSAVRGLCASIGRSSSVLIVDRRVATVFTQVIRGMCGVPVGWTAPGASASEVDAVLAGVVKAGRHPVVLGASPGQVARFGGQPTRVLGLLTTQDPHSLTQPPSAPWPAKYVIWMASVSSASIGL